MSFATAEKMYDVLGFRDRLNGISKGFPNIGAFFGPVSLGLPKLQPAELGFIRVVSWLYVHYFEAGKLGIDFATSQVAIAGIDSGTFKSHRTRIQQLRTYCQHNLTFADEHSNAISAACEAWFKEMCGTHHPSTEHHWSELLTKLIDEAAGYFNSLERILRSIEVSDACEQILEQWNIRIKRFHAPHKFEKIIDEVAADWGHDNFNAVAFRKRFYDRWRNSFEYRTDECDFETEARRLVELALLSEQQNTLPIDGRDVMAEFDIPPGRRVKEVLQIAQEIFSSGPCAREELLTALRCKLPECQSPMSTVPVSN